MAFLEYLAGVNYAPDETGQGMASQTGTAPGQQSGQDGGQSSGQTSTPTGTSPGHQEGKGEGGSDTLQVSKADLEKRIDKAKRSGVREVLQALGFESLDSPDAIQKAQADLADLVAFAREQRKAQMTAEEQVAEQVKDAVRRAEAAEARLQQAEARAAAAAKALVEHVRDGAVLAEAGKAKHPEDVLIWARTYAADKLAKIVDEANLFTEDGSVNPEAIKVDQNAVKDLVTECMKARREWFQVGGPGSPSNAGGKPPGTLSDIEKRRQIARQIARL